MVSRQKQKSRLHPKGRNQRGSTLIYAGQKSMPCTSIGDKGATLLCLHKNQEGVLDYPPLCSFHQPALA